MTSEIISVGDELLIGQTVNTNAAWIAEELFNAGIKVKQISTMPDNESDILRALEEAEKRADIILISGGLGPTADDKTRDALCKYFNAGLIENKEVLNNIIKLFSKRGLKLTKTNRRQALVPENCKIIQNKNGTAPGMMFEKNAKLFFAMPGVPFELMPMLKNNIIPVIKKKNTGKSIICKTILTHGIGESFLADKITSWEKDIPPGIGLAYLPSPGIVKLRLSGEGKSKQKTYDQINTLIDDLKTIIPEYIFGEDDDSMQSVVGNMLKKNNSTLSVAESCTGGMISHLITTIPRSSRYFTGSVVAYDNTIKVNQLNTDKSLLEKYGAVCKEVSEAMATNIRRKFQTDYALATTGIAGPEGGTDKKPVGLVWIALATKDSVKSKKFLFGINRERNILITAIAALNMLRLELLMGIGHRA